LGHKLGAPLQNPFEPSTTFATSEAETTAEAPTVSSFIQMATAPTPSWPTRNMSTKEREQWFKDNVPTAVQLAVEGNFGKPNINQSFFSAVTLRHVVPLLSKSGFVSRKTGKNMEKAFYPWLLYN
jgi:hypothetical protein